MKYLTALFFFIFIFLGQNVSAIQVSGLYQATVPVTDETAGTRRPAIKQALILVLIKLTGDRNIAKSDDITPVVTQAERLVQQFRYRQVESQADPTVQMTELLVQFDEGALNDSLTNQGLAIWGKERPSILVWLAHEQYQTRSIVSFEESPEYMSMLDKGAEFRGLPLLFPLLDLEDNSQISVSDVWGDFKEPIVNASSRYQADVLLTGRLIQVSAGLWEARWSVYMEELIERWSNQSESPEMVLEEGINEVANRIASQYANTSSTLTEVIEIVVTGVNDVDEYAKTLAYLESIQSISSVQVKRVYKDNVLFELINRGGLSAIDQSFTLGKMLEQISNNEQLTYRLLP